MLLVRDVELLGIFAFHITVQLGRYGDTNCNISRESANMSPDDQQDEQQGLATKRFAA